MYFDYTFFLLTYSILKRHGGTSVYALNNWVDQIVLMNEIPVNNKMGQTFRIKIAICFFSSQRNTTVNAQSQTTTTKKRYQTRPLPLVIRRTCNLFFCVNFITSHQQILVQGFRGIECSTVNSVIGVSHCQCLESRFHGPY